MTKFTDIVHLAMASYISEGSPDPSTKVGAVITRNNQLISYGYNSFPHKCTQSQAIYHNRDRKLNRIIHAEVKALLLAGHEAMDATLYVWPPSIAPSCACCTAIAIEAGITRFVYFHEENQFSERWEASLKEGLKMIREAKLTLTTVFIDEKFKATLQEIRRRDAKLQAEKNARISITSNAD